MHPETMIRHISEVRRIGDLRGDDIDCWCDGAPDANPDHQPCPMCRALEAGIEYGLKLGLAEREELRAEVGRPRGLADNVTADDVTRAASEASR